MPASQSSSADQQSPPRLRTWRTMSVWPGPGPPPRHAGLGPSRPPGFWSGTPPGQRQPFRNKLERKAAVMSNGSRCFQCI